MANDWPFLNVPGGPATSVLACLGSSWPNPVDLTPTAAGLAGAERSFLLAFIGLQDAGLVMCEALFAGAGQEPRAVGAVLTAKGRNALARLRPPA